MSCNAQIEVAHSVAKEDSNESDVLLHPHQTTMLLPTHSPILPVRAILILFDASHLLLTFTGSLLQTSLLPSVAKRYTTVSALYRCRSRMQT